MRKTLSVLAFACLVFVSGSKADTVATVPFLGNMLPQNETPPTSINSSATAVILVHEVLDASGALKSGSVEFTVIYKFPAANTVVGLHIHSGATGVAGPIVIPTDINGTTNSVAVDATGAGTINRQVQFGTAAGQPALSVIQDLLANPQNYYVNIHTTDFPGGAMRSQLLPASSKVLMAQMSPANEVPPIPGSKASAVASVRVLRAQDSGGNLLSALVTFDANYTGFPDPTTFTGFHIHNGPAGVNAGVVINTGIGAGAASVPAGPGGAGNLHYDVLVAPSNATQVAVINGLFTNPTACCYINIHNTVNPGGEIRDQLRTTDSAIIQAAMSPANETPPIATLNASAPAAVSIYTIRNADGSVAAGTVKFDVNARFPGATKFVGLHIHDGAAGVAGPVTIPTDVGSNNVSSDTGNVSIYRWVTAGDAAGVKTLNNVLANPSTAYVNLHTSDNPGGAVRAQLGVVPPNPTANAVAPNVSTITGLAPGTIASIYGINLAPFAADLSGISPFFPALPITLNGVTVTVAGNKAPLYYVSPGQINFEVPYETQPGNQNIVVGTAGGNSTVGGSVSAAAPSIFILDATNKVGSVVKGSDFSLITATNKVAVGDLVVIYSTGLGQTTPTVGTGTLVVPPSATLFNNTVPVAVTVDTKSATIVYSLASPGFTGLYQTAFTVPSGVSGPVPLVLSIGTAASNTVTLNVQ
jgi:uncharacterized protein (TIGR03437 family)